MGKVICLAVLALAIALVALGDGQAQATGPYTRWVYGIDPDGGGYAPPGTNCADPGYSTISFAEDASGTDDIIKVCPGLYNEKVVVDVDDLTIEGSHPTKRPVIDGTDLGSVNGLEIDANDVWIGSLEIANFGRNGILLADEAEDNTVYAIEAHHNGRNGIHMEPFTVGNDILHSTFQYNNWNGISLDSACGCADSDIFDNSAKWNGINGILLADSGGNHIEDNTISHNTEDGIHLNGNATGNDLFRNNSHHNLGNGIEDESGNNDVPTTGADRNKTKKNETDPQCLNCDG